MNASEPEPAGGITVRRLAEEDLAEADRIMRLAFGTFLGLPDPMAFMGDAEYARARWAADPESSLAAEVDGRLVGTNFVSCWGSVGFFGPLTVEPWLWDRGVARALLDRTMPLFDERGVRHRGLFTFGHSPKHVSLYQRYGFLPGYLSSVLGKPVAGPNEGWTTFSALADVREGYAGIAAVTGSILDGLDLRREVDAARGQKLGDTVLVYDADGLAAFGICHVGPGTEAGSETCFVKFGAARSGPGAEQRFARLLDACEGYAAGRDARTIVAGVSTGRRAAYRQLLDRGYKAGLIGVTMHQPDDEAYHHPNAFVIDDWR
ncbi:GNAT family N-acetyltransferase [Pseudonocardia sp. NPDC049154]|uniref:GNAT family N-acetyltransferase n=1 Tax=Pseudonocardia sp. NPDC049154 TaxID=3155501 RepID=UPI0033E6D79B